MYKPVIVLTTHAIQTNTVFCTAGRAPPTPQLHWRPHAAMPPTAQSRSLPPPPLHTAAAAVGRAASAARAWPARGQRAARSGPCPWHGPSPRAAHVPWWPAWGLASWLPPRRARSSSSRRHRLPPLRRRGGGLVVRRRLSCSRGGAPCAVALLRLRLGRHAVVPVLVVDLGGERAAGLVCSIEHVVEISSDGAARHLCEAAAAGGRISARWR